MLGIPILLKEPVVKSLDCSLHMLLGYVPQIHTLGEILPKEPVGVAVQVECLILVERLFHYKRDAARSNTTAIATCQAVKHTRKCTRFLLHIGDSAAQ